MPPRGLSWQRTDGRRPPSTPIAAEASVAPQTIYAAFGNKRALLEGMRHAMLRDSKIPELMARAAAEPDVSRRLGLWAQLVRQQMETSYDVISIHRQAAASDPIGRHRLPRESWTAGREASQRSSTTCVPVSHHGIDESTASDLLWCFSNEEIYRELVEERGWSADRYEQWLAATLDRPAGLHTYRHGQTAVRTSKLNARHTMIPLTDPHSGTGRAIVDNGPLDGASNGFRGKLPLHERVAFLVDRCEGMDSM